MPNYFKENQARAASKLANGLTKLVHERLVTVHRGIVLDEREAAIVESLITIIAAQMIVSSEPL